MTYQLPKLPYAYDALEPFIDAKTMEIHHTKHHATYVQKLNEALSIYPELQEKSLEDLLSSLALINETVRTAVRNFGGGHYNHSLFWEIMASSNNGGGGQPKGKLAEAIILKFGSLELFKEGFSKSAATLFGSGWVWLSIDTKSQLVLSTTQNQDSPLSKGERPIIGLDVWEHAYYLKYQNKRTEYIDAWWNVVNWNQVAKNFEIATK